MRSEPALTIGLGGVAVSSLLLASGFDHPALALAATATSMVAPVLALAGIVELADRVERRWIAPPVVALLGLLAFEIGTFHAEHWARDPFIAMPALARVVVAALAVVLAFVLGRQARHRAPAPRSMAIAATGLRHVALAIVVRALGALIMFLATGRTMHGQVEAAAVITGAMCGCLSSVVLVGGLLRVARAMPVARGWATISAVLVLWPLVVHTLQAVILLRGHHDFYVDFDRAWLGTLTVLGPLTMMAGLAALLRAIDLQGTLRSTNARTMLGVLAMLTALVQLGADVGIEPYQTDPRDVALVLLIHLAAQLVVVLPCLDAAHRLDRAAEPEPARAHVE